MVSSLKRPAKLRMSASSHMMPDVQEDTSFDPRTLLSRMLRKNIGMRALKMGNSSTIHVFIDSQIVGYQHDLYVDID